MRAHLLHLSFAALVGMTALPASAATISGTIYTTSGAKTAVLRDMRGAVISHMEIAPGAASARISTIALPAGLYTLELRTNEGNAVYKLVKE